MMKRSPRAAQFVRGRSVRGAAKVSVVWAICFFMAFAAAAVAYFLANQESASHQARADAAETARKKAEAELQAEKEYMIKTAQKTGFGDPQQQSRIDATALDAGLTLLKGSFPQIDGSVTNLQATLPIVIEAYKSEQTKAKEAEAKVAQLTAENASIRGNVDTRLRKVDAGEFDAIVLARAGLVRLGLEARATEVLEPEVSLPAVGQGALGIESRIADADTRQRLAALADEDTSRCVHAERGVLKALGADCKTPLAAFAERQGKSLRLRAFVVTPEKTTKREETTEPWPGTLAIWSVAPWRCSTCLTMARPRPVPPVSRERLRSMR
jgi:hypothetical protein